MLTVTIGICAYNEEKNIGKLLQSLMHQKVKDFEIIDILVISSGSIDRTDDIVKDFITKDKRIRLIIQKEREGKASAINVILNNTKSDIIVLASADILPIEDTIYRLALPFQDKTIGMTGGHPVPIDNKETLLGFTVNLLWKLHHRLALLDPKLGEIIAFRNIVKEIPKDTAVDEASIEAIIKKNGFRIYYVPEAIVYNKGPSTIDDFLLQRRRIYSGHLYIRSVYGYSPSSMSLSNLAKIFFEDRSLGLKNIFWTFIAVFLEVCARLLGMYDFYIIKKNPVIWEIAKTTKEIHE